MLKCHAALWQDGLTRSVSVITDIARWCFDAAAEADWAFCLHGLGGLTCLISKLSLNYEYLNTWYEFLDESNRNMKAILLWCGKEVVFMQS
jgi:hypothetical protein